MRARRRSARSHGAREHHRESRPRAGRRRAEELPSRTEMRADERATSRMGSNFQQPGGRTRRRRGSAAARLNEAIRRRGRRDADVDVAFAERGTMI